MPELCCSVIKWVLWFINMYSLNTYSQVGLIKEFYSLYNRRTVHGFRRELLTRYHRRFSFQLLSSFRSGYVMQYFCSRNVHYYYYFDTKAVAPDMRFN